MFQKSSFKYLLTFTLIPCAVLTLCDCAEAQNSTSFFQIRNLSAVASETTQETNVASRLFAIKEKKPLPAASQLNTARIVRVKSLPPLVEAKSKPNTAPASPPVVVTQLTATRTLPQSNFSDNAPPTTANSATGYYTVSFAQQDDSPQPDEPDSPMLEQLETDDPPVDDVDEDLESSKADDDVGDLDLADEESADELDYDEDDDSPIARPEFGKWPSKSIREVRLDVTETGTEAPQDRANALFKSSRRLDGSIAAREKVFAWAAPNISYQPLYFEDVALERYGQTAGLVKQPFVSAGRFLADRQFLGTRALRDCPQSCDSPLGFCRPGSPSTAANCGCAAGDCQSCR